MATVDRLRGSPRRRAMNLLRLVGFGLAIFVACWAVVALPRVIGRPAPIWLANAMMLALLMHLRPRQWVSWLAVGYLGNVVSSVLLGRALPLALATSACNIVGVLAAASLLWRVARGRPALSRISDFARFFLIAGLASPLLTAALAAQMHGLLHAANNARVFTTWTAADALGNLIVVPVLFSLKGIGKRLEVRPITTNGWLALAMLAAVSVAVFSVRQPLAFLIPPALLLVVFQLEMLGAAWGVTLVVLIAITMTYAGLGPMASVHGDVVDRLLVAQIFLASLTLSSFPTAALLVRQRRLKALARTSTARVAESEARYRLLADAATDVVVKVDAEGVVKYVSPAIGRYGFDPASLPGISAFQLVHPDDVPKVHAILAELVTTGTVDPARDRTYRLRTADGDGKVWMEGNPALVKDSGGKVVFIVTQLRDISERKRADAALAESEARFRLLADSATDVISRTAMSGELLYLSPAIERFTGYTAQEMQGRNILDFVHPDDLVAFRGCAKALLKSERPNGAPFEYRLRHKDGRSTWVESNPTLLRDEAGVPVAMVDVSRDVTAHRALEAELRAARDTAEAAAAVKGEFLANMSHELRTPLTSVIGFTRLALDQPELSEASRNFIAKASNAGAALLSTVNDILDFSKLESRQLQIRPEPFHPAPICRDTLELFGQAAADKGVVLRFEEAGLPPALSSDPNRLRQVLLNLIGNAVKFTDSGAITLTAEYRDSEQRLHVSVKDDGPGISAQDQALLFRRFSQVDGSSTRRHGGTGLGLAICLGLVEAMGGEIGVESEPGEGARFFFDIAAPTVDAVRDDTPLAGQMFAPGTRVLVADDHPVNREYVALVLSPFGAVVTEAANGAEAVALAGRRPFDIILMDLRMPELDGMDAMKAIRASGGPNADAPILAFSAGSDAPGAELRRQAGFDGDLAKPVLPEGLITAVARFTGGWEQADAFAASAA